MVIDAKNVKIISMNAKPYSDVKNMFRAALHSRTNKCYELDEVSTFTSPCEFYYKHIKPICKVLHEASQQLCLSLFSWFHPLGKMQDWPTKIECLLMLENADIPEDLNNLYICRLQSTDCLDMVAIVRIPSTFRNDSVFLLYDCCDPFIEKALRASRGASFQLPIVFGEWIHLKSLKEEFEMRILAGHPANNFTDSLAETPLYLKLGSEGSCLSEKSRQECELVSIPMAREFESLNVSVAVGIFLYMLQPNNSGYGRFEATPNIGNLKHIS
ncbi:hypothetical protein M9H77_19080 [Catharanthus roseus]|uniref:Uncharacterized protein n=1 Tax=Catharanthus roseus TaxID=4058 RepID=A0ACC0B992_CATRO|nr:hypothetical protein M9H77_19080 [Catharanthus roseus]